MTTPVGRVLGTLDAMPLEFWVGVEPGEFLQLDDVVEVETPLPHGDVVRRHGLTRKHEDPNPWLRRAIEERVLEVAGEALAAAAAFARECGWGRSRGAEDR